jgi:hypothetical protein
MYNGCLRSEFSKETEKCKADPNCKTWKRKQRKRVEISPNKSFKYWGKGLEKVPINRINLRAYSTNLMSNNQKSTTNVANVVKDFVEGLKAGKVLVLVRLDVKGAFDAYGGPEY